MQGLPCSIYLVKKFLSRSFLFFTSSRRQEGAAWKIQVSHLYSLFSSPCYFLFLLVLLKQELFWENYFLNDWLLCLNTLQTECLIFKATLVQISHQLSDTPTLRAKFCVKLKQFLSWAKLSCLKLQQSINSTKVSPTNFLLKF